MISFNTDTAKSYEGATSPKEGAIQHTVVIGVAFRSDFGSVPVAPLTSSNLLQVPLSSSRGHLKPHSASSETKGGFWEEVGRRLKMTKVAQM